MQNYFKRKNKKSECNNKQKLKRHTKFADINNITNKKNIII